MEIIRTGNKVLKEQLDGGLALNKTSLWLSLSNNYKTGHLLSLLTGAVLYNKPPEGKLYTGVFITAEDDVPALVIELYTRFKFAREDLKVPRDSIDIGIAAAYVHRFALDHGWQLDLLSVPRGTVDDEMLDDALRSTLGAGPGRVPALVLVDNLTLTSRLPPAQSLERLNLIREERNFHLAVTAVLERKDRNTDTTMPDEEWLDRAAVVAGHDELLADQADYAFVQHVTNRERIAGTLNTGEVTYKPAGARADLPRFVLELNDVSSYIFNEV